MILHLIEVLLMSVSTHSRKATFIYPLTSISFYTKKKKIILMTFNEIDMGFALVIGQSCKKSSIKLLKEFE